MSSVTSTKASLSFDSITLFYVRFLRIVAVLPYGRQGFALLATRALFIYFLFWTILHWSDYVSYSIYKGKDQTVDSILELVQVVGNDLRYYMMLWRGRELEKLLVECRDIWDKFVEEEDRLTVKRFERKARTLFLVLLSSCAFTNIMFSVMAVYLNVLAAQVANKTHPAQHVLPYKWFADGTEDIWPGYKITFAMQVLMIANCSLTLTSVDSTAPALIMIGAGYFRALQRCLDRAYDRAMNGSEKDTAAADIQLLNCCRLHQCIIKNIEALARSLFFVQLLGTSYNMSLIAIKFVGTDPDRSKYLPVLILHLGQLYICQWAPDHLIDESSAISTAAYRVSFPWMSRRIGKVLLLMIARAQQPVQMTVGGVVNLSLENFGAMLKSIVSFFTVLRNFTD